MKKALFALTLLMPAFSFSAVKMDVKARLGQDATAETFTFTEQDNKHGIVHSSGVTTEFMLTGETPEKASFDIKVSQGEKVLQKSSITLEYNKEASLKCSSEAVDAEVKVTVSQLSVQ